MPQITSRICGVCPTAHHMASTKALDAVYKVTPPPAALRIRELFYNVFMVEDHSLHIYFLGGAELHRRAAGAGAAERNILGVIGKVGVEVGQKVVGMRRKLRELLALTGGKAGHPVLGLTGGVAKRISKEDQAQFRAVANEAVDFASSLSTFSTSWF
jgi:F420-non-reducing hydrogenase large subunit